MIRTLFFPSLGPVPLGQGVSRQFSGRNSSFFIPKAQRPCFSSLETKLFRAKTGPPRSPRIPRKARKLTGAKGVDEVAWVWGAAGAACVVLRLCQPAL